jgi:hypothetical protein
MSAAVSSAAAGFAEQPVKANKKTSMSAVARQIILLIFLPPFVCNSKDTLSIRHGKEYNYINGYVK